jgi:hypothetical protein
MGLDCTVGFKQEKWKPVREIKRIAEVCFCTMLFPQNGQLNNGNFKVCEKTTYTVKFRFFIQKNRYKNLVLSINFKNCDFKRTPFEYSRLSI